jgi:hypothetical protein
MRTQAGVVWGGIVSRGRFSIGLFDCWENPEPTQPLLLVTSSPRLWNEHQIFIAWRFPYFCRCREVGY